jgi:hypothetical protein
MTKTLARRLFDVLLTALLLAVLAVMCGELGIPVLGHKHDKTPVLMAPGGPVPYPTGGGGGTHA